MANPIIGADIPKLSDAGLLAAYQMTDGTGPIAELLLAEIERRNLDI
ncbi:hypothetical protein [Sphingomonas sp. PP-CC-1A-547]|nr:hypothetical protein [Sphingomonas sp. PP-CC-1A-547]RKE50301.1 hypothetical protein C8J39_1870 [Sphingomonas sp. PP-CC-1A-547]